MLITLILPPLFTLLLEEFESSKHVVHVTCGIARGGAPLRMSTQLLLEEFLQVVFLAC